MFLVCLFVCLFVRPPESNERICIKFLSGVSHAKAQPMNL